MDVKELESYAFLKVNWEKRGKDYIDIFVPLVTECVGDGTEEWVSVQETKEKMSGKFGLDVPVGAVSRIMDRASDEDLLEKDNESYRCIKYTGDSFGEVRSNIERKIDSITNKFISFAEKKFDEQWTEEEAQKAILDKIRDLSSNIIKSSMREGGMSKRNKKEEDIEYQVSRYISYVESVEPEVFDSVVDISKGSMLASVLYHPDPVNASSDFENLDVYLDTPLIVSALGVDGDVVAQPVLEMIELLKGKNVNVNCFRFTTVEVANVLQSLRRKKSHQRIEKYRNESGRRSNVNIAMNSRELKILADNVEREIEGIGIDIDSRPGLNGDPRFDRSDLETVVESKIGYREKASRDHDVRAVTAVFRLREGTPSANLEQARSVFVTDNRSLIRATSKFFANLDGYIDNVPLCIHDHELATRVWLKSPLNAAELPEHRIIADSYATLSPPDRLWDQFVEELDDLKDKNEITEREYFNIKIADETKTALSDATLNDPDRYEDEKIGEIIEKAKNEIRSPTKRKLKKEREEKEDYKGKYEKEKGKKGDIKERLEKKDEEIEEYKRSEVIGRWNSRSVFWKPYVYLFTFSLVLIFIIIAIFEMNIITIKPSIYIGVITLSVGLLTYFIPNKVVLRWVNSKRLEIIEKGFESDFISKYEIVDILGGEVERFNESYHSRQIDK